MVVSLKPSIAIVSDLSAARPADFTVKMTGTRVSILAIQETIVCSTFEAKIKG